MKKHYSLLCSRRFSGIILFFMMLSGFAAAPNVTSNTKILAHFDDSSTIALDYGSNTTITTYGNPQIINTGRHGKCLSLGQGDYITFNGADNIGSFSEGTIMFWIRPHWNNNLGVSHTFCAMPLYNDGNDGYLTISDGWWSLDRFYAISNNQFSTVCHTPDSQLPLLANKWYHIAMTFNFDGENNSFTKLYINGELAIVYTGWGGTVPGLCSPRGDFQLGSSVGIYDGNARYADADFDELAILDKALSDTQMKVEYNNQTKKEIVAHFDRPTIQLDLASSDTTVTLHGNPTVINDGVIGSCLSLGASDYITFNGADNIGSFSEGTIMFWTRPHWNNNLNISHTFCAMPLYNDGNDGYLAISDGWWSLNRFYAISNNQFSTVCHTPDSQLPLLANEWYHIAMTFRFGGESNSFTKLYINGELATVYTGWGGIVPGLCAPRGDFQLGSSIGIYDGNARYADADFDEFYFSNQITLADKIKNTYDIQSGNSVKIFAGFANKIKIDSANNPDGITETGTPQITYSEILNGKCLSLGQGDYLTFNGADNIGSFSEGTIMFWTRPHWNNNLGVDHTFCSMLLYNDGNDGYLTISDGWWDSNRFYAMSNNQFSTVCHKLDSQLPLLSDEWYHIAMTFRFDGEINSFTKLYVNGELEASYAGWYGIVPGECSPRGDFQFGSSTGIYDGNARYVDADISNLYFLTKIMDANMIKNIYKVGASTFRLLYKDIYTIADDYYNPPTSNGQIRESRILFDEAARYNTKIEAETMVNKAKDAGFNIIMTCVFHGSGAKWDSSTIPVHSEEYRTLIEGKEPLKYLIDYAHSKGIDVHAWFCVNECSGAMISLYAANNWIDSSFMENGNYKVIVHYPEFRSFFSDMVQEVVDKYDIDGVNLDYIRARGWATTSYCQNDYSTKYPGRSLTTDITNNEYSYLGAWNHNAVTDIVDQINTKCNTSDPDVQISVCNDLLWDVSGTFVYAQQGRDGIAWVNAGYIDFMLAMDYRLQPEHENFRTRMTEITGGSDGKLSFIIGNYDNPSGLVSGYISRDADYTATLLLFAQRMKTGIVACYIYNMLSDDQINTLKNGPFKNTAVPYYR
jgi:glycosyl hydrolase family 10/concanavalin A-like lectin/glucanase superfamily protein